MSSREASVRRILFYPRHGIPAQDETAEEKTLRDLLTDGYAQLVKGRRL
jgi:hypothetical protein